MVCFNLVDSGGFLEFLSGVDKCFVAQANSFVSTKGLAVVYRRRKKKQFFQSYKQSKSAKNDTILLL